MKLSKILKNRKAMTPLMIGLIVAASVIAVLFIVMASVIPVIKQDVFLQIRDGSIKANSTDSISLIFNVMCDYDDGDLWSVEVYKDNQLYGTKNVEESFVRNEERTVNLPYLLAEDGVPVSEIDSGRLVFQNGDTYVLRIYYHAPGETESLDIYSETSFVFSPL
ncbi:MAG: hypothetical protein EAX90_04785 [Candidatus Heimdallarchaeota archaeon]|nr:hypothetical protein [Candidatus Heimdallarchaeota archaeon]